MGEQLSQVDIQQQELVKQLSWTLHDELWETSVKWIGEKYLQLLEANLRAGNEQSQELKLFQVRIEWLKSISTYQENNGYEPFLELLKHQEASSLDSLFYTISHSRESSSYIEMNWFPTNKTSINLFNSEFGTQLSATIENDKLATNSDEACTQRLVELYNKLDVSGLEGTQMLALLRELDEWNTKAYPELKQLLLEDANELQKLLLAAKKADESNPNSHVFQEISLTLIDIDPSFGEKIRAFEQHYSSSKSLETSYLLSLSGSNIEKEGNSLISRWEENETIAIDMGKTPPVREISLEDNQYAIESNFPLAELHKPEQEYQKIYMDVMPKIRAASFLKTQAVQEHIKDLHEHRATLDEIKSTLKLCYQIDVSFIESLEDLQPNTLESHMQNFQSRLDTALEVYKTGLDEAILANREKVKEQDRQKREILHFVKWIGFDLIDQNHTDSIIQEVKNNSLDVYGLDLAVSRLDIANGMFGESPSEYGATKWKQNLIEFYNKMISGDPNKPLSVEAHISAWGKVEDRTQMQYQLKSHGLLSDSWAFNKEKARENLRHVI